MKPTGPEGLCDGSLWGVKEADTGWTSSFPLQNPGTRGHHLRRSHRYQLILHFDCQGLWLPEDPPPEPFPHGDRHDIRYVWHTLRAPCNSWWNIYNSFFLSNAPPPQFFWSTGEWEWYHICFYLFKKKGYTSQECADEWWLAVNNFNTLHQAFCSRSVWPLLRSLSCPSSPSMVELVLLARPV